MKILLIQHLSFLNGSGGTEKICSFLANNFINEGYEVIIATHENVEGKPMFSLDEKIVVQNIYDGSLIQKKLLPTINYKGRNPLLWLKGKLNKKLVKAKNRRVIREIGGEEAFFKFNLEKRSQLWKKHIDQIKPDLIVTMSLSSVLEITYNQEINVPIINSVNGRPDYDYSNIFGGKTSFETELLINAYKEVSAVQVLFNSYRDFLPNTFSGIATVIPNPIPGWNTNKIVNHQQLKDRYKLIHIARLDMACKQQHLAISSFAKLVHLYPNWDFELWGIGNDYIHLKQQIEQLNLQNRIFLKGFTEEPLQKMKEADIFIFPSKYEGFGLALGEAMTLGLPVIGFQSCSGVNELILDSNTGFLVSDLNDMQSKLSILIEDSGLRGRLGKQAHESMKQFQEEFVIDAWLQLLKDVIENRKTT